MKAEERTLFYNLLKLGCEDPDSCSGIKAAFENGIILQQIVDGYTETHNLEPITVPGYSTMTKYWKSLREKGEFESSRITARCKIILETLFDKKLSAIRRNNVSTVRTMKYKNLRSALKKAIETSADFHDQTLFCDPECSEEAMRSYISELIDASVQPNLYQTAIPEEKKAELLYLLNSDNDYITVYLSYPPSYSVGNCKEINVINEYKAQIDKVLARKRIRFMWSSRKGFLDKDSLSENDQKMEISDYSVIIVDRVVDDESEKLAHKAFEKKVEKKWEVNIYIRGNNAGVEHPEVENLKKYGDVHYFSDISEILFDLTRDLIKDEVRGSIAIYSEALYIGHEKILNLQNHPMFCGVTLEKLKLQLRQIEEKAVFLEADMSIGAADKLQELRRMADSLRKSIDDMETCICKCQMMLITGSEDENAANNEQMQREAEELIRSGKYTEARRVLEQPEWESGLIQARNIIDEMKNNIAKYISSRRLLIADLEASSDDPSVHKKITEIYETILSLYKEYHVGQDSVYDYAEYLYTNGHHENGINIATLLYEDPYYSDNSSKVAFLLGNLNAADKNVHNAGEWYDRALSGATDQEYSPVFIAELLLAKAENSFKESDYTKMLSLTDEATKLLSNQKTSHEIDALSAYALQLTGTAYTHQYEFSEAIASYLESISVLKELTSYSSGNSFIDRKLKISHLRVLNLLGIVYRKICNYPEAERIYSEVKQIREDLLSDNSYSFVSDIAESYRNESEFLRYTGNLDGAESACNKCLETEERNLSRGPLQKQYLSKCHITLSVIYIRRNDLEKAEKELFKAEDLMKEAYRMKATPDGIDLPSIYYYRGIIEAKRKNYNSSLKLLSESIRIVKKERCGNGGYYDVGIPYRSYLAFTRIIKNSKTDSKQINSMESDIKCLISGMSETGMKNMIQMLESERLV